MNYDRLSSSNIIDTIKIIIKKPKFVNKKKDKNSIK